MSDNPLISPARASYPDNVMVRQPLPVDGDHHSIVRSMDLVPHRLGALCAFAHVPHEWYNMDIELFPVFVFINIDNSLIDCTRCNNCNIILCQYHHQRSVLVSVCHDSTIHISFHVHDLDVGLCQLVE
jgi:hypothetical protein